MTNNFYLLGPNIADIPKGFDKDYDAEFIKSDFSTVAVDIQHAVEFVVYKNGRADRREYIISIHVVKRLIFFTLNMFFIKQS